MTGTATAPIATSAVSATGTWSARIGNATASAQAGVSQLVQTVTLPVGYTSLVASVAYRPYSNYPYSGWDTSSCVIQNAAGTLTYFDALHHLREPDGLHHRDVEHHLARRADRPDPLPDEPAGLGRDRDVPGRRLDLRDAMTRTTGAALLLAVALAPAGGRAASGERRGRASPCSRRRGVLPRRPSPGRRRRRPARPARRRSRRRWSRGRPRRRERTPRPARRTPPASSRPAPPSAPRCCSRCALTSAEAGSRLELRLLDCKRGRLRGQAADGVGGEEQARRDGAARLATRILQPVLSSGALPSPLLPPPPASAAARPAPAPAAARGGGRGRPPARACPSAGTSGAPPLGRAPRRHRGGAPRRRRRDRRPRLVRLERGERRARHRELRRVRLRTQPVAVARLGRGGGRRRRRGRARRRSLASPRRALAAHRGGD